MRQVINKLIREEDLYAAVDAAFSQGWRRVKLYFLIGLPTETDEDVLGIARLAGACADIGRRYHRNVTVTASVGGFVPKAHTPFQWFGQNTMEELRRKVGLLKDAVRGTRGLTLRWHDPEATAVEGLVSRGDRRMGAVIEHVWRHGGTFQEWSEHFDLGLWRSGLEAAGLDFGDVVYRHRDEHEVLAWDHVSAGLHRDFLWQDFQEALAEHGLEDCRWTPCYDCGACTGLGVEHMVASAVAPAGGSQGTGQDLAGAGAVPVRFLETAGATRGPPRPERSSGEGPGPLHQDRQGAVDQPPRRGADVGAGPAPQPGAGVLHGGVHAPSPAQLRARPPHGVRVDRRVPRRRAGRARRPGRAGAGSRVDVARRSRRRGGGCGRARHRFAPGGRVLVHVGDPRAWRHPCGARRGHRSRPRRRLPPHPA